MDDEKLPTTMRGFLSVSPYLLRPLRSHAQALADIAAAKGAGGTVTPLVPLAPVDKKRRNRNSDLAA